MINPVFNISVIDKYVSSLNSDTSFEDSVSYDTSQLDSHFGAVLDFILNRPDDFKYMACDDMFSSIDLVADNTAYIKYRRQYIYNKYQDRYIYISKFRFQSSTTIDYE